MPIAVSSARERPAKPALSRAWMVAVTIEIMRHEGLEKATMRRVAQALDTGPASLYVYVTSTAELHAAVVDELLASMTDPPAGDARARLRALLDGYARIMFSHPGLARSALTVRAAGSNAVVLYDRLLGLLLENGLEAGRAAWGVDLLLQYLTATAAEHGRSANDRTTAARARPAEPDGLASALRTANPERTPHVAAHADALLSGSGEQRVDWALAVLLTGITATPVPDSASPPDTHPEEQPS